MSDIQKKNVRIYYNIQLISIQLYFKLIKKTNQNFNVPNNIIHTQIYIF